MSIKQQLQGREGISKLYKKITTDTTTAIFANKGTLMRVIITKDTDGGTGTVKNTAGDTLFSFVTDFPGTYEFRIELEAGCGITTASFAGGEMLVVYIEGAY